MNTEKTAIFEVMAEGSGKTHSFGARKTLVEAEKLMQESIDRVTFAGGVNKNYWIEEKDTTGMFQIPSRPAPREKYEALVEKDPTGRRSWKVAVMKGEEKIGEYERNYSFMDTFEPFRQGGKEYALISADYEQASVMDLQTGKIIAGEEDPGFCPTGFFVPDWWDVFDGSILPGSTYWDKKWETWPNGTDGFVIGCYWGDDSSWKVQHLDLSEIEKGIITRSERYGYLPLASFKGAKAKDLIHASRSGNITFFKAEEYTLDGEAAEY